MGNSLILPFLHFMIAGRSKSRSVTSHVGGEPGPLSRAEGLFFRVHFANEMLQNMKKRAENATPLFSREVPFQSAIVHDDDINEEIMKEIDNADFNTYTQAALEMVRSAKILILERQAKDQLEGGKFLLRLKN